MHLVTFRKGRSQGRVGAIWREAVLDLGAIARDLAAQSGAVGRGRGGFPKTMLELVQGGEATLTRGPRGVGGRQAARGRAQGPDELAAAPARLSPRQGAAPSLPSSRRATCSASAATTPITPPSAAPPCPSIRCTSPSPPRASSAPAERVVHHAVTKELDYEVELSAVIGTRRARYRTW